MGGMSLEEDLDLVDALSERTGPLRRCSSSLVVVGVGGGVWV